MAVGCPPWGPNPARPCGGRQVAACALGPRNATHRQRMDGASPDAGGVLDKASMGSYLAVATLVVVVIAVPPVVGLLPTPASQWAGLVAGILMGSWLQFRCRKLVQRQSR